MRLLPKILLTVTVSIISLLILAEIALRIFGIKPDLGSESNNFFVSDSLLGWKNSIQNNYQFYNRDRSYSWTVSTDSSGNRITSEYDTSCKDYRPSIQIYGCSFTFGSSVNDSATATYKLQSMLPKYKVENKGVCAYGLTQMYLSLQKSVANGDTPKIAILNYAGFQDMRTPLSKEWGIMLWCGYKPNGQFSQFGQMSLPYYDEENGVLTLKRCAFKDLRTSWPLVAKSSVMYVLFTLYAKWHDDRLADSFHHISLQLLLQIMQYCQAHHIIPVMGNFIFNHPDMVVVPNDMPDSISHHGYHVVDYGINVADSVWNCHPYDRGHPNSMAHTLFANKLFHYLTDKNLW